MTRSKDLLVRPTILHAGVATLCLSQSGCGMEGGEVLIDFIADFARNLLAAWLF